MAKHHPSVPAFNLLGIYTPKVRLACHLLFWFIIGLCYSLKYIPTTDVSMWFWMFVEFFQDPGLLFMVLKDLFVSMTIFYAVSTKKIPNALVGRRVLLLIPYLLLSYIWWAIISYVTALFYLNYLNLYTVFENYFQFLTEDGLGSLLWSNFPLFAIDFLFVIMLPLAPKLMKGLMQAALDGARLERDNLELELNFLKSQINPHFLFNTLNNTYQLLEIDYAKGRNMVLQLSALMQYTLYESKSEYIPLQKEIKFLNDYIALMRVRYGDKITIHTDIATIEDPYKVIPLLLIPLVENAFKHGPDQSPENDLVSITIKMEDDLLCLDVENKINPSLPKAPNGGAASKIGGVGLQNIKRRLELRYKNNYQLAVKKKENNYRVSLKVNLK